MLKKCCLETNVNMEPPLSQNQILTFIDWLARVRGLKSKTIDSYLAGIRQLHIVTGLTAPVFRSDLVKLVLTLTLTSESVYGSQFFHYKLLQVLMS